MTARKAPSEPKIRDSERSRAAILVAAREEFSRTGLGGARVERIAEKAAVDKKLVYYYFKDKDGLFAAALESVYAEIRDAQLYLDLQGMPPLIALRRLIEFTWDYYIAHPEFITLLNSENLHRGKHISKSLRAREYSSPAIGILDGVLRAGAARGVFRADVSARDLYLMIASMGYFYLSNRYTLSAFLGEDLEAPAALAHWERFLTDAVLRNVSATSAPSAPAAPALAVPP